jgi:hypothetical protein
MGGEGGVGGGGRGFGLGEWVALLAEYGTWPFFLVQGICSLSAS